MKKTIGLLILAVTISLGSFGQNEIDALRYSMTDFYGTARSMSMGGSFGAFGADFSALSYNPAGLGLYKSSEFVFTPTMSFSEVKARYYGTEKNDSEEKFFMSNIGIVFANEIPQRINNNGWRNVNFAFGLNKLRNFNNNFNIQGTNTLSSYSEVFAHYAQGINYQIIESDESGEYGFDLYPAWWLAIIDTLPGQPDRYKSNSSSGPLLQQKTMETYGGINEIALSFGANYSDKLYVGATLGFPTLRYTQKSVYSELKLNEDANPYEYREFVYREKIQTSGTGVNLKFGMIYRPFNAVRIAAAFHSPTWYTSLEDEWSIVMESKWDPGAAFSDGVEEPPVVVSQYNLRTPMKVIGSIGFIIGQYGLVGAEYEMLDYGKAKLSSDGSIDYDYIFENDNVKAKYGKTQNIRLGTEWRIASFCFRGGYAIYGSPFKDNINDAERTAISAGIGYRDRFFFIDLAWVQQKMSEDYYLYGYDKTSYDLKKSTLDYTSTNMILTIGYRFQ